MKNELTAQEERAIEAVFLKPAKRPSMRKAINAKCKDCIYDQLDVGTWRQQVAACGNTDCSLYLLRPLPTKT